MKNSDFVTLLLTCRLQTSVALKSLQFPQQSPQNLFPEHEKENITEWLCWEPGCTDTEKAWQGTSCSLGGVQWSPPSGGAGTVHFATAQFTQQKISPSLNDSHRNPGLQPNFLNMISKIPRVVRKCIVKSFFPAWVNSFSSLIAN